MVNLIEDAKQSIAVAMSRILRVWDIVGIDQEYQEERSQEIMGLINGLVMTMAEQEEAERDSVLQRVHQNKQKLISLSKEMGVEPQCEMDLPFLDLDEALCDKIKELEVERERRLHSLVELESRLEVLQESLMVNKASGKDDAREDDLSIDHLQNLQQQIDEYEQELQERRKGLCATMDEIKHLWTQLQYEPANEFEQTVAQGIDRLPLSPANILALHRLRDTLKECIPNLQEKIEKLSQRAHEMTLLVGEKEENFNRVKQRILEQTKEFNGICKQTVKLWEEEIARLRQKKQEMLPLVILKTFNQLSKLWESTYFCAKEAQKFMLQFDLEYPLEFDDIQRISDKHQLEQALTAMEDECARQVAIYEEHKDVFQAVSMIEKCQAEKAKVNEDDLLHNRGGLRFKISRMDKQIDASRKQIVQWERRTGRQFMVR